MGSPSVKIPSVNLTKYVNLGNEQWRFCPVVVSGNGRVRQDQVVVNGQPETHKEGAYYIEWYEDGKRRRQSVGKIAPEAQFAQQRQAQVLAAKAHGIVVVQEKNSGKVTLGDACEEFLEETRQQRKPKTYQQYRVALEYFQESSGKNKRLGDIDRKDLLAFIQYLRQQKRLSDRTVWTKLNVPIQMLKGHGIANLMRKSDWPRYVQTEPDVYSLEEIETFLAACDPYRRTLFEFLWMTGFREQEAKYVMWRDVDFKQQIVRVTAKRDRGFVPKTWEEREVPIPDSLVGSLTSHRQRLNPAFQFIFPTSTGQVNHHFLEICKSLALEAGLNCGNCDNGQSVCSESPTCDNWFLHKFRATFATMHLQAGVDLRTVQDWMGHKDLASTMRYLKPARGNSARQKVNHTFGRVAPVV